MHVKLEAVSLKKVGLSEKWVQDVIAQDPSILGLGKLELKDKERGQPHAGRLDLLLRNPESLKRYEVELQLGTVDESHIIRTIEYWDIERKLYPQYEHAAVIVAEDITARFLNVIHLFNGSIPLIALKMTAYKVGEGYALTFVRVLDEARLGLVEEDEPVNEPSDRTSWEQQASAQSLQLVDSLMGLVRQVEPKAAPTFKKQYVGLEVGGSPMNFVAFVPKRKFSLMHFKIPQTPEWDELIDDSGLNKLQYDSGFNQYRLKLESADVVAHKDILLKLIKAAYDAYKK